MTSSNPEESSRTAPLPTGAAARALGFALESRIEETSGVAIGPYKLLQKIGEGGFGVVWMAEQQHPIRRRVAVKIIKIGMDTEEVIARFEAERQALALMEHPNIARVFDAGSTDAGRPYFAMELVRGLAITRYCDENRLSAEARLRLFITVCQAVQHAHQKGVIHRDLKPSNILVTLHDGVPVPKIIDFGIAKATSARLTEKTLFTQFHAFIGTPAYTSPEQMEMSGLDIDTRSDIYSLGVLLYELLTGKQPFDSDALVKSGLEAMRRTIREIDPPRPSTRLSTLTELNRTSVAHQRSTDAGKLSLLLRGDLDWIAMRCLEKDRTRRYDSATSLAADIERHLSDTPVLARPPSRLYQAKKFVRRHKLAVGAAAAIAASLIAGLVVSSTLLVSERFAHHRAALAEKKESDLRHQAEVARAHEVKRAARTALDLANRNLSDGRIADGLAYLVYAARKDPLNRTLAPRIASALASHNFLLPTGAPFDCGSRILAVRFAKDGGSFFVGTEDGTFCVMDAATGALQRQFQLGREVVPGGWEFARLNDTVVGARFSDNSFAIYDLTTGAAKIPPLQLHPSVGIPDSTRIVGFSPNGRWIYANARQEFWLWNANTGALQLNLKFTAVVGGCDFSPTDDTLAIAVGEMVERWTLPAGQPIGPSIRFRAPSNAPRPFGYQVRFSPDGRRLAVSESAVLQIFDASTGALTHTLPGDISRGLNPAFTAFATNDRVLVLTGVQCGWWDLGDGRFTGSPMQLVSDVSLDAAGKRGAAVSLDGLRVFEVGSSTPVAEPAWRQSAAFCAAVSPDGAQVLMGTSDGLLYRFSPGRGAARPLVLPRSLTPAGPAPFLPELPARLLMLAGDHAKVIQVASGREIAGGFRYPEPVMDHATHNTHPSIRPDLKFMVVRTASGGWKSWELGSKGGPRVAPLQDATRLSAAVTFSPMNDLVTVGNTSPPRVWNLRSGAPVGPPLNYPVLLNPFSPSFSPDARRLAMGANDGAALVFDVTTGLPLLSLKTRRQVRTAYIQFSPDGERVLTTNIDGESRLWNAITGDPIGPNVWELGPVGRPVFSPDGRWVALHNPTASMLLDGRTGVAAGNRIPAGGNLRFSADGNRLGTAERGGNAQVWDVLSGDAVTEPLRHHPFSSYLPEFSPDGRFLRTENQNYYLWAVPPALPEGASPPEWLLELATLCASKVVNDSGQLVAAPEAASKVDRLRHQIATLPADAPLAAWGRWILNDRPDRPIAPGFTITPAEADALAAEKP